MKYEFGWVRGWQKFGFGWVRGWVKGGQGGSDAGCGAVFGGSGVG